jgi:hypothetical protein
MTYEVKRFDLLSVFKVSFLIYLAVGFLIGIFYALIVMKMMAAFSPLLENEMFEGFGQIGMMGAMMMALFMAIFMAVIWSILTVIATGIYNVFCGFVGGVKLELDAVPVGYPQPGVPPVQPPPAPPQEVPPNA